jgi:hypothetical protein
MHNKVFFKKEIGKSILKFLRKHERPGIAKAILSKKSNNGGITISDFRVITIKIVWYWHKNIHKDQWNRIGDPDKNPCSYNHLLFDKGVQNIQ